MDQAQLATERQLATLYGLQGFFGLEDDNSSLTSAEASEEIGRLLVEKREATPVSDPSLRSFVAAVRMATAPDETVADVEIYRFAQTLNEESVRAETDKHLERAHALMADGTVPMEPATDAQRQMLAFAESMYIDDYDRVLKEIGVGDDERPSKAQASLAIGRLTRTTRLRDAYRDAKRDQPRGANGQRRRPYRQQRARADSPLSI